MPRVPVPSLTPALTFPSHQACLDHWVEPGAPDAYTPMPDGLSLFSNGYGFYEALSATPYNLCKPQTQTQAQAQTQTYDNIEYRPELKIIPCDQSCAPATRFFSPGEESCTPPGTPASTAASAPSPSTPTSTSTSTPTEMTTTTHPGFESGFDESAESEGYPAPSPLSPTSILSTDDARQLMETYVRRSAWFQTNVPEPSVGDLGVPTCALLLARPGESVYRCFVDTRKDRKGRAVYYCGACGFKSDRLHRLVGHQRSKRGHRPFACPDHGCDFRGYSAESLGDHRSGRNGLQTCEWCGDTIVKKNMARHLQVIHAHVQVR